MWGEGGGGNGPAKPIKIWGLRVVVMYFDLGARGCSEGFQFRREGSRWWFLIGGGVEYNFDWEGERMNIFFLPCGSVIFSTTIDLWHFSDICF